MRRRGKRHVALAAEEAGGVEPDPARAGQIYFRPGMQRGAVAFNAAVTRVRGKLDEITGNKARRQAGVAQNLNQQPGGIAAGADAGGERLLGRLHACSMRVT